VKCRHSLQKSIISFFVLTCVVLVVGYTFFLSNYLRRGFELFVEFRLEEASTNYLKEYARNPDVPCPTRDTSKGTPISGTFPWTSATTTMHNSSAPTLCLSARGQIALQNSQPDAARRHDHLSGLLLA
jgi:hypothetical protein